MINEKYAKELKEMSEYSYDENLKTINGWKLVNKLHNTKDGFYCLCTTKMVK